MKIKYQIFISSTYEDLKDIREQMIKCILEMGHIPVGMEMFSAANEEQWKIIQKQIDDCDYYVVIIAHRYGSLDKDISFTEKEYDYAISKNIPVLAFVIDESTKWPPKYIDSDENTKLKLIQFKEKVKTKMISIWKNSEDLYGKAAIALSKAFVTYERPGYIRADEVANKDVYIELARLSTENSLLRNQIKENEINIVSETERKELELISILESNKRQIPIRFVDKREWIYDFNLSLLEMFEIISMKLLIEASEGDLREAIALGASNRIDYMKNFPVPTNRFSEWMSDLYALELIEPSKKVHSVNDTEKYWSMTTKGKEIAKNFRKLKLVKGIASSEEKPIDDNNEKAPD